MRYSIALSVSSNLQLSCRQILTDSNAQCPNATAQCLCSSSSFQADAAHCIKTSCTTETDQMNAYNFAVQVCAQVGITLPSFNDIGKASAGAVVRVGYGFSISVLIGTVVLVVGLI